MRTFDWESWVASRDEPPEAPPPLAADAPERVRLARETVVVLDRMVALFDQGRNWGRGPGRFSLAGALASVRHGRTEPDRAGVYLRHASRENWRLSMTLVLFSNSRGRYAEIGMVIRTARMNANLVVDKYWRASAAGD
jgi:hypothetical protein